MADEVLRQLFSQLCVAHGVAAAAQTPDAFAAAEAEVWRLRAAISETPAQGGLGLAVKARAQVGVLSPMFV